MGDAIAAILLTRAGFTPLESRPATTINMPDS